MKQRVYAQRFRRRRTADLGKLRAERRDLEAAYFCMVTLATFADDLLRLVEVRIAAIWRWAHAVASEQVTPQRINKRRELLAEIRRLTADAAVSDSAFRLEVLSLGQRQSYVSASGCGAAASTKTSTCVPR